MADQSGYISVKNLKKYFIGKMQENIFVLDNVSFEVGKGEFICIVGGSGCGKSTLLRILSGLDSAYEGQVMIHGERINKPDKKIGFVYQEHRLFPWLTVEKNIRFVINEGREEEKQKKVEAVLELVGLNGFKKAYPKELSGGMAQRVNIARALVNTPEILFLDEPFASLDALTRIELQKELVKIGQKKHTTMLLVTHDIEEAVYLADRVIVLGNRPASIMDIIKVDLPKERDRSSVDFQAVRKDIFRYFKRSE